MHITIDSGSIASAIALASRAISAKPANPITGHLLVETENGRLKVMGTNGSMTIIARANAQIHAEGGMTMPARDTSDIVAVLQGSVDMEQQAKGVSMRIKTKSFNGLIKGFNISEFPSVEPHNINSMATISGKRLSIALGEVMHAAASDQTRPQLAGVYFQFSESKIRLVCCDSFRLSLRDINIDQVTEEKNSCIVPLESAKEIARLLSDIEENVEVLFSNTSSQFIIKAPDLDIITVIVDGNYVSYENIVNTVLNHPVHAVIATSDFMRAMRATNAYSRDSGNSVRIEISVDENNQNAGSMMCIAESGTVGSGSYLVENIGINGIGAKITANTAYLADSVSSIRTKKVAIYIHNERPLPVLLQPAYEDDDTSPESKELTHHIIMPMNLQR